MADFQEYLASRAAAVDAALEQVLTFDVRVPDALVEGMRYTVFAGGKRIRPILTLAACEALGGDTTRAMIPASAIELIHTFSLIHDDLPSMDDDDLRRGKPTLHKVMGEGNAILVGDALQAFAYEIIAGDDALNPAARMALITELARATGLSGMVAGQIVDLESEDREISAETLDFLHSRKTGALITASVRMGGICASADERQLDDLSRYGNSIGLAFQIVDDILDVTGDTESLGKAARADEVHGKATYPAIHGMEASRRKAAECLADALHSIESFGNNAENLRAIASFIVNRST